MKRKINTLNRMYISILSLILVSIFVQIVLYERFEIKYIFLALSLFGVIFFLSHIENKKVMSAFLIIMLIIRLFIIFKIKTPPISDFEILFNSAEKLLYGNNVMNSLDYFYYYPYQSGVVLYFLFLLKICNSIYIIKIANVFFSVGMIIIVYIIAREFASEKNAKVAAICYALFPFPLFYNTILSNQIPAAFFSI